MLAWSEDNLFLFMQSPLKYEIVRNVQDVRISNVFPDRQAGESAAARSHRRDCGTGRLLFFVRATGGCGFLTWVAFRASTSIIVSPGRGGYTAVSLKVVETRWLLSAAAGARRARPSNQIYKQDRAFNAVGAGVAHSQAANAPEALGG